MHFLQPKHIVLKPVEVNSLLEKFNISVAQLPKIKSDDPAVPEGVVAGNILKIEREEKGDSVLYYRVVA